MKPGCPLGISLLATICLVLFVSPVLAEEKNAEGETPTPLAGEEFDTEVMGEPVKVPARDRKNVTAASFGVQYLPASGFAGPSPDR